MPDLSNRRPVTTRIAALPLVLTLVAACSAASATPTPSSPGATPGASPTPAVTAGPTVGAIDHKTGATDVILRLEEGGGFVPIDFLASQAPSFTLYGDGVIVFQPKVETVPQPDASGVVHGVPWRTAKLDEGQIQELLGFALGPGALGTARDSYFDPRIADAPNTIFTIDAGGVDKSVVISALSDQAEGADAAARAGFWKLASRLRDFDSGGTIPTDAYQADRYRGVLFDREPQAGPAALPWPWADIPPTAFKEEPLPDGGTSLPRHTLTQAQVEALGTKDVIGGLQGVVLSGPNGKSYTLTVRPLLVDEPA
jgi:hypothetical protein